MSHKPSLQARQKRPETASQTSEEAISTETDIHNLPKEPASSDMIANYLQHKHGIELGVVGWISCIAAVVNITSAIKTYLTASDISRSLLTQTALSNQIAFLKMCLDYPQLGSENSTLSGSEALLRKVPCEAFLRALDFDAMSQVLVGPRLVPDIRTSSFPLEAVSDSAFSYEDTSVGGYLKSIFMIVPEIFAAKNRNVIVASTLFMCVVMVMVVSCIYGISWVVERYSGTSLEERQESQKLTSDSTLQRE